MSKESKANFFKVYISIVSKLLIMSPQNNASKGNEAPLARAPIVPNIM